VSKKKKNRKPNRKTHGSTLAQHKRKGKTLTPPLGQLPNLTTASWVDERLPELLWAVLLVTRLAREDALSAFRRLADKVHELQPDCGAGDITHSGLATLTSEHSEELLGVITMEEEQRVALTPLLIFPELPAKDAWHDAIDREPEAEDWDALMFAAARTLDHQSQESTDCRWAKVLAKMAAGKMSFEPEMGDTVKCVVQYPHYGDLRHIHSFIRAVEIGLPAPKGTHGEWAKQFWTTCLDSTPCQPLTIAPASTAFALGTTNERYVSVHDSLVAHCKATRITTSVDAKHDTVFGTALYALALLQELLRVGNAESIGGRSTLRSLVESHITLAYLAKKDEPELWKSYRAFSTGQAKLALLKLQDSGEFPHAIDETTLTRLANEDIWQEFAPINLGHWEKTDLRKMSEFSGTKGEYDRYYSWTSCFAHGHWAAVRNAVFDTCGNPLHRLHRIPRDTPRSLADVIPDACALADKILVTLAGCYPPFEERISVTPSV